jgi:hypothetical protein
MRVHEGEIASLDPSVASQLVFGMSVFQGQLEANLPA